jgi:CO/xanthine dehydrogenase FAD-binding subunit
MEQAFLHSFDYICPRNLEEAATYLSSDKRVALLGGGNTLLLQIRAGEIAPDIVLDLKRLPGFRDVRYHHNQGLKLGAGVNLQHLATGLEIRRHYPLLHQTAQKLASPQVRNRATIGGTLAWASPVSELAAPMLCYDAVCHTWSPQGRRELPLHKFYLGEGETALAADEIITHVHLPAVPNRTYGTYLRQTVRHDGRRMIAAAAVLATRKQQSFTQWRIAVLGVDHRPKRIYAAEQVLEGSPTPDDITRALAIVQENIHPQDTEYARADYRRATLHALLHQGIQDVIQHLQTTRS